MCYVRFLISGLGLRADLGGNASHESWAQGLYTYIDVCTYVYVKDASIPLLSVLCDW